jgi:hypothetical protein
MTRGGVIVPAEPESQNEKKEANNEIAEMKKRGKQQVPKLRASQQNGDCPS